MLNYRQLHYFWVVAKTGSIVRAGEQLNLTPQTISGQISLLEHSYGIELFRRVGRQLELTETGRQALSYAEQMFQIGGELEAVLRAQPDEQQILFRVGVADVVPKSIVYRLLAPTMELPDPLRLTCREDKLERLLADLAVQRLDLVISDSPMPSHLDIKGYSLITSDAERDRPAAAEIMQVKADWPRAMQTKSKELFESILARDFSFRAESQFFGARRVYP